jgi:hypothetical protein
MNVRFKKNPEPCITYRVLNNVPSMQYDEYFKKYMECIEIEVMGLRVSPTSKFGRIFQTTL